jgi:hypothetical protein
VYCWEALSKKPQGEDFSIITYFIILFLVLYFEGKEDKIARLFSAVFTGVVVTSLKKASFLAIHTPQVISNGINL